MILVAKDRMEKSRFRSRTEHSLDSKGRLNFPSRFREVLRQYDSELLMVTAWGTKYLRAYPLSEWEILEDKLWGQGQEQPGLIDFVRYVVSGVTECSLDKQGRILLPAPLRKVTSLKKEVVLNGMKNWVEIWDKEAWLVENRTTADNFENFGERLTKLGIF